MTHRDGIAGEVRQRLDSLRDFIGTEPVVELIDATLEDVPELLARIAEDVVHADLRLLRDHAHGLKGTSSNVGAATLSAAAGRLQRLAEDGTMEASAPLVKELEGWWPALRNVLLEVRASYLAEV